MVMRELSNISRRLAQGLALLIFLFVIVGFLGLYNLRTSIELTYAIYDHPLVVSNAALRANVSIIKINRTLKDLVQAHDPDGFHQVLVEVEEEERLVQENLRIIRDRILGEEGQNLEQETRLLFERWLLFRKEIATLTGTHKTDEAVTLALGQAASHLATIEKELLKVTDYARGKATHFIAAADSTFSHLYLITILLICAGVCLSLIIAVVIFKKTSSAEKTLRESWKLLDNAIQYAPIGMVLIGTNGRFDRENRAFCEMLGYSESEFAVMSFQDITHPDDKEIGADIVAKLKNGEIDQASFEKRYMRKDGSCVDAFLTTSMVRDAGGEMAYFFTQVQDVTEKKRAEKLLKEKEAFISSVLDHLPVGVAVNSVDRSVQFEYLNDAFLRCYRTTREALGQPDGFWAAVYEDEEFREKIRKRVLEDCASGDLERMVWPDIPVVRDDQVYYVTARNIPIPEKNHVISIVWDVTSQKNAELLLLQSEQRFRALFSSMSEGVCLHEIVNAGSNYRILEVNPAYERLTELTREQVVGKTGSDVYGVSPAPFLEIYRHVAETGTPKVFETYFPPMAKYFRVSAFSYAKDSFATVFSDITDMKLAEEENRNFSRELEAKVVERTDELAAANRELEDFVYSVSHDLRAPLRSISGFSQIINRRYKHSLDEEGQHYFANIVSASEWMGVLIDDLLNFSKLGRQAVKIEKVDLDENFRAVLDNLHGSIAAEKAEIVIPETMPTVWGDEMLIRQIFLNLIDNGIKYRRPDVRPRIVIETEASEGSVEIRVSDNGIGIDPQFHDKIFQIFQRLHSNEEYLGSGIGLAMVKKSVEILGGTVSLVSTLGEGSVFTVRLPFKHSVV